MKIYITRQQSQHGSKFEYRLGVKIQPSEEEKQLLEKYKGWQENICVLPGTTQVVRGPSTISMQYLVNPGQWWSGERLYEVLTDIPKVLANSIHEVFAAYYAREEWGTGEKASEVIEV
jgi:hypothetical protein